MTTEQMLQLLACVLEAGRQEASRQGAVDLAYALEAMAGRAGELAVAPDTTRRSEFEDLRGRYGF